MLVSGSKNRYILDRKEAVNSLTLNFGPQHPAAHGVLRLILKLEGERIVDVDTHIGLLHRGTERLIESKTYLLSLPYFDRLDYVSVLVQEHAYCLAVERIEGLSNFMQKTSQIRTSFDELTRILNHLLAISCHALDVGSMSSLFWAFEEREGIMEFYEAVSGARVHAAYYRPGIVNYAIDPEVKEDIITYLFSFFNFLNNMSDLLTNNIIWKKRLINVGTIDYFKARTYGLTGVLLRSTGAKKDTRTSKRTTYGSYIWAGLSSFVTTNGDCYDRYNLRMAEMHESAGLVYKILSRMCPHRKMHNSKYKIFYGNSHNRNLGEGKISMEHLIRHFKIWSEGEEVSKGHAIQTVESPKGELSVTLFSNGSSKAERCKIKSPAYNNLQLLNTIAKGTFLTDLVTLIGTIDIVFGEIDR